MSERIEVRVPDIGEFTDVPVIEVLVSEGDEVEEEQSLLTLESDKATMEIPSPAAGVIAELRVALEDTVSEGDVVAILETAGDDGQSEAAAEADQDEEDEEDETQDRSEAGEEPAAADEAQQTRDSEADETPGRKESVEVRVPDIGDFSDVPVIEVLVSEGDEVEEEQSLITLESDKATMEVPSPLGGRVREVRVSVEDTVSEGDVVAVIETSSTGDEAGARDRRATAEKRTGEEPGTTEESREAGRRAKRGEPPATGPRRSPPVPLGAQSTLPDRVPYASPAVRSFARELGVDLFRVRGSGRKGRIVREDVIRHVKSVMSEEGAGAAPGLQIAAPPQIDFSRFGDTERRELSRIRRIGARNLHRNWVTIPHVTHNDLADITAMEQFRKENADEARDKGFKLTPLAFLIRASVAALTEFPDVNASLDADGEHLILKRYYNIGIAVDTEDGLVVPVLRDCEQKGILQLAEELAEVSERAREGKLKPEDWQGASFTISSLGGIGGTSFSPIINLPEVAILGVSRAKMQPVWDGEKFNPRLMLPLSLSYDHRVIDGALAARFTRFLAEFLEDEGQLEL